VYDDNVTPRTRVFEWHQRFKEGREEVEDDERPRRPSTSKTEENFEKSSETVELRIKRLMKMYYWEVLTKLRSVRKKRPELWGKK
jgi:hypothetical protein